MNILEAKNAAVIYDKHAVGMTGINFTAEGGKITAICGEEGVGKTTLLYAIARIVDLTEGSIEFCGEDIREKSVREMNAFLLSDAVKYTGGWTGKKCISRGLIIRGEKKEEAAKIASKSAELLGLNDLLDKKIKAMSEDEKLFTALCAALARKVGIILVDMAYLSAEMFSMLKKVTVILNAITLIASEANPFPYEADECVVLDAPAIDECE